MPISDMKFEVKLSDFEEVVGMTKVLKEILSHFEPYIYEGVVVDFYAEHLGIEWLSDIISEESMEFLRKHWRDDESK